MTSSFPAAWLILNPILVGGITQIMKAVTKIVRTGTFRWHYLTDYGDFPSSHTSFVVATMTVIALHSGVDSTVFFLSAAFAVVVIRDAWTFRQKVSRYGEALKRLTPLLTSEQRAAIQGIRIEDRLGHTLPEILGGAFFGVLIAWGFYQIFFR